MLFMVLNFSLYFTFINTWYTICPYIRIKLQGHALMTDQNSPSKNRKFCNNLL